MVATVATDAEVFQGNAVPLPGLRRHVLDLDDFTAEEIAATLDNAAAMRAVLQRDVKKVPALRGRVIVTLFYEASTRTRISFEEAGKILSADVINMTASASSIEKGESLLNTGLTLQAMGVDVIVVRHPHAGAPHFLARNLRNVAVINAGDGAHAHPTQGLLDLYTARDHLGGLAGRKVVIVGDVLHSRVARSAVWGFAKAGASVILSGPPTLMPDPLAPGGWGAGSNGIANPLANVSVEPDLDAAIEGADLVMALRLQSGTPAARLFPQHPRVHPPLAGQRRADGTRQPQRSIDAPRPDERGHRSQQQPGPRRTLAHRGTGHQRRGDPHGPAVPIGGRGGGRELNHDDPAKHPHSNIRRQGHRPRPMDAMARLTC